MKLKEALNQSSFNLAIIILQDDMEFILATQNGTYHNFYHVLSRSSVYAYPIDQNQFNETHVFADHQYIDTRAPESILWTPLERDMTGVPEWGKAELAHVLGWQ